MAVEMKYELVESELTNGHGTPLYRIRALKDFSDVKKGDLGGYVAGYHNLTQEGDAWIYEGAKAFDRSLVADNAKVSGRVRIFDRALVGDNAVIKGTHGGGIVFVSAKVTINGDTHIYGVDSHNIKVI